MTALNVTNDYSYENIVEEVLNNEDPESDSKHFVAILIECLFLLDKIPECLEVSFTLFVYLFIFIFCFHFIVNQRRN